jgi:hypothetical protein
MHLVHVQSTVSLTLFDVLLTLIVLPVAQVLCFSRLTSSGGMTSTDAGKKLEEVKTSHTLG